jgi:hypothetical protein
MIENIVNLLKTERDRIDAAILALRGEKRRGRPRVNFPAFAAVIAKGGKVPQPITMTNLQIPRPDKQFKKKRRAWTAKQRAAQGRRIKAMWAAKRKAA